MFVSSQIVLQISGDGVATGANLLPYRANKKRNAFCGLIRKKGHVLRHWRVERERVKVKLHCKHCTMSNGNGSRKNKSFRMIGEHIIMQIMQKMKGEG